jgi:Arc/MetJ family transcription regulator
MSKITISLDADLVIDLMLLTGVRNAQDAVELVVRDYLVRGSRTEAVTGNADEARRVAELESRRPEGE